MIVASILKDKPKNLITATVGMSISDVAKLLNDNKIGAVVVKDGEKLAGILSERDIVRELAKSGDACLKTSVDNVMTKDVKTTTADVTLTEILAIMTKGRFRHIPVMEDDTLVGIVSIGDIVKHRLQQLEQEADTLRDYVAGGY